MTWFQCNTRRTYKPRGGKRYTDGYWTFEVRENGVYEFSLRKKWSVFQVRGTKAVPVDGKGLTQCSFNLAQRALDAYAKRLALQEVAR